MRKLAVATMFGVLMASQAWADMVDRGARAALNYHLVTNARNVCGLVIDEHALLKALFTDGIDVSLLRMLRNGETPPAADEDSPTFKAQLAAWRGANKSIAEFGNVRSYCIGMWSMFGSRGAEYPDVLLKPERPFSLDELPN